jgi:hypothetical protein
MAEELTDSKMVEWFTGVDGSCSVDLQLVWRRFSKWFNVETWVSPANGGWVYVPAALPLGFKSRLCRARPQ